MIGQILFLVVVLSSLSNVFALMSLTHEQAQRMLSAAGDMYFVCTRILFTL